MSGTPARVTVSSCPTCGWTSALLAAYERVCGFPTGEDSLPLTYPHVLGFPLAMRIMSGRGFPLPLLGLVHTSIEITRRTGLAAMGAYELTVYVDRLAAHRRGTEAVVVTELRERGALVWESTSTYLARHRTEPVPALEPAATREPVPVLDEWRLAADVGRRYGAASGDRNPIHLHALTARLFGFPRPSRTACGPWPAVSPHTAAHRRCAYGRSSGRPSCCRGRWPSRRTANGSSCAGRARRDGCM